MCPRSTKTLLWSLRIWTDNGLSGSKHHFHWALPGCTHSLSWYILSSSLCWSLRLKANKTWTLPLEARSVEKGKTNLNQQLRKLCPNVGCTETSEGKLWGRWGWARGDASLRNDPRLDFVGWIICHQVERGKTPWAPLPSQQPTPAYLTALHCSSYP